MGDEGSKAHGKVDLPLHRTTSGRYTCRGDGSISSMVGVTDGDTRACYGRMEWRSGVWRAEIVRLPYDRERAEYDFIATGYLDTSGPVARLVYDEFRTGWPRIYTWVSRYREAVLAGELSDDESFDELLALCNGGPPPDWKQPAAPFS